MSESAQGTPVMDATLIPNGYEQKTSTLSEAVSLVVPDLSRWVVLQAEAQDIRWRDDGTTPTSTVGMLLKAGESFMYNGQMHKLQVIRVSTGAVLNANYYK